MSVLLSFFVISTARIVFTACSKILGCADRWKREEKLAQLYLRLNTWDTDGPEQQSHNFYDVLSTFILLGRGASFVRLPGEDELVGMRHSMQVQLGEALRMVGGYPERCGICVAAMDVTTKGIEHRFRSDADAKSAVKNPATVSHVMKTLPPGKYCHSLALDRPQWDDLHVSRFEIQEQFARNVVSGLRVLVARGAAPGPTDRDLTAPLRFASKVSVITIPTSASNGVIPDLGEFLNDVDLLLLVGLPTGVGALVAIESTCSYGVQAIDAGQLVLISHGGQLSLRQISPLRAFPPSAATTSSSFEPMPRLVRSRAKQINLNGFWEVRITTDDATIQSLPASHWGDTILVPFTPQSHGGLATKVSPFEAVWYRRRLELPPGWCGEDSVVHLHIDACDWECTFFLNGSYLDKHLGGYDPFSLKLDLSSGAACNAQGIDLVVRAWDPTDFGCEFQDHPPIPCDACCESGWQPRGKQTLKPGSIMYTGVSGIWRQGIWLERVPECHFTDLALTVAASSFFALANVSCGTHLKVELREKGGATVAQANGSCCEARISVSEDFRQWSPASPVLYEAVFTLDEDSDVAIRPFAHRDLSMRNGRVLLNGSPVFMHGVLYQGYWPESLLTPPTANAIEKDLSAIKEAGFNTVRVHAVVMSHAFYTLCDQIGLLVWQDMPAGDMRAMPIWSEDRGQAEMEAPRHFDRSMHDEIRRSPASEAVFRRELHAMVTWLLPFASIVVWVIFNEGWGQSNTQEMVAWLRVLDPTRLISAASGWNDVGRPGLGDFIDVHNYEDKSSPFGPLPDTFANLASQGFQAGARLQALGEYGGLAYAVEGHEWSPIGAWGYGDKVRKDAAAFAADLNSMVVRLQYLICKGLSAAIYTQWNDVETEMNGLITYDRHLKLPMAVLLENSRKILATSQQCQGMSR